MEVRQQADQCKQCKPHRYLSATRTAPLSQQVLVKAETCYGEALCNVHSGCKPHLLLHFRPRHLLTCHPLHPLPTDFHRPRNTTTARELHAPHACMYSKSSPHTDGLSIANSMSCWWLDIYHRIISNTNKTLKISIQLHAICNSFQYKITIGHQYNYIYTH